MVELHLTATLGHLPVRLFSTTYAKARRSYDPQRMSYLAKFGGQDGEDNDMCEIVTAYSLDRRGKDVGEKVRAAKLQWTDGI